MSEIRNFSVTSRGVTTEFASDLSHAEMLQGLYLMANRSDFARDLYRSRARLSAVQVAWGHKLVMDAKSRPAAPAAVAADMAKVFALLDTATASGLSYPKLRFVLPSGARLVLRIKGEQSASPGSLSFTTGSWQDGTAVPHGQADRDGKFRPDRRASAEVLEFVAKLAADPKAVIVENGKLAGACCFCGRRLDDERSLAAGYGKTCAGNWGMPWGDATMSAASLAESVPAWIAADNAALAIARADDAANPGRFDNLDAVPHGC